MNVGKALRLRRIFGRGRALVVDLPALEPDPVALVRRLAHTGVDAIILSPGLLETVAEELGDLAVILSAPVDDVLQAGADAVVAPSSDLPQAAPAARRSGIPVFARMPEGSSPSALWNAVHVGADVLCLDARSADDALQVARAAGRAVVAGLADAQDVVNQSYELLQRPVQGLLLRHEALIETACLDALHALVHQGVSAAEAASLLQRARAATQGNRG